MSHSVTPCKRGLTKVRPGIRTRPPICIIQHAALSSEHSEETSLSVTHSGDVQDYSQLLGNGVQRSSNVGRLPWSDFLYPMDGRMGIDSFCCGDFSSLPFLLSFFFLFVRVVGDRFRIRAASAAAQTGRVPSRFEVLHTLFRVKTSGVPAACPRDVSWMVDGDERIIRNIPIDESRPRGNMYKLRKIQCASLALLQTIAHKSMDGLSQAAASRLL